MRTPGDEMKYRVDYDHLEKCHVEIEAESSEAALAYVREWLRPFDGANGGTHFYKATGVREAAK